MYSQYNEEEIILKYFGSTVGRFLDIGAYDGKTFSNTYALAEKGWRGTLVEPAPVSFKALQDTYTKIKTESELVNAAVGPQMGIFPFFDCAGDAVGSLSTAHMERWKEYCPFHKIYITVVTVQALLAALPGPYDFISIDAEGVSLTILEAFLQQPQTMVKTKLFCVEAYGPEVDQVTRIIAGKYHEVGRTVENILFGV